MTAASMWLLLCGVRGEVEGSRRMLEKGEVIGAVGWVVAAAVPVAPALSLLPASSLGGAERRGRPEGFEFRRYRHFLDCRASLAMTAR